MKPILPATVLILVLAGCSQTPAVEATPTPTVSVNIQACSDFEAATNRYATLTVKLFSDESLTAAEDDEISNFEGVFDTIALSADGEVAERMSTVTDLVTDAGITLAMKPTAYFDALDSVARACKADGQEIAVTKWS